MVSLTITWHTRRDDRVCPICQALEGYTWTFECGKDQLTGQLVHPVYGVVWDTATGSGAHGHQTNTCRCKFSPSIDLGDLVKVTEHLRDEVKAAYGESEA